MKTKLPTPRQILLAAGLFLAFAASARAQNSTLFNFVDNTGGGDIYLTFFNSNLANSNSLGGNFALNVTYQDTTANHTVTQVPIYANFSAGANIGNYTSSILLSDVYNGNFTINDAGSARAFISYGAPPDLTSVGSLNNYNNPTVGGYNARITPIEFFYDTTSPVSANGDLSYINFFSSSVLIQNYTGPISSPTLAGNSGIVGTSTETIFRNFQEGLASFGSAAYAPNATLSYPATIITSSNSSTSGTFQRVLGTNSFPQGTGLSDFGYYASFDPYMAALAANNSTATISRNATYQIQTFRYDYQFTLDPHLTGNNTYIMNGSVVVTDLGNFSNISTFSNLSIEMDSADFTLNAYLAQYPAPGVTFSGNWAGVYDSQGAGNSTLVQTNIQQEIVGDLGEALNLGVIGSTKLYNGTTTFGNLSSQDWWNLSPTDFFANVSIGNIDIANLTANTTYYNLYAAIMHTLSGNGSVLYASPYDDRFTNPADNPGIALDTFWKITLNPDGNLNVNTVPEPATYAVIFATAGLAVAMVRRKRKVRRRKPAKAAGSTSSDPPSSA